MIKHALVAFAAAALLTPLAAGADGPTAASSTRSAKEQFVRFTDQEINAIRRGPTVSAFSSVSRPGFGKLLVLKKSFLPALESSGQELVCRP